MSTTTVYSSAQYICNLCDCVSTAGKGDQLVQQVFEQFPYANTYKDRSNNAKSTAGTIQIKGDGVINRFVINMYAQYYPGSSKYHNDDLAKRLEWFTKCLSCILDNENIRSLALPSQMGGCPEVHNRYMGVLDTFEKKYYLKHGKKITIFDYHDNQLTYNQSSLGKIVDDPISSVTMGSSKIVGQRLIDITKLVYVETAVPKIKNFNTCLL